MNNPKELKYTEDHEWVRIEGDLAYVGITDHAQDALGDIVFVELPEAGRELERGEEASNIESVKAAAPVYSPLTGSIAVVNKGLDETPELLNQKPYDTFVFALKIKDANEIKNLLSSDDYDKILAAEKER